MPAHTPTITNASTIENAQSTGGLVLTPDPADRGAPLFYKITNITGGTLFLSDGVTPVPENSFITAAQGLAGLKFTPFPNSSSSGSFKARASLLANDAGLGGSAASAMIGVNVPGQVISPAPFPITIVPDPVITVPIAGTDAAGGDCPSPCKREHSDERDAAGGSGQSGGSKYRYIDVHIDCAR